MSSCMGDGGADSGRVIKKNRPVNEVQWGGEGWMLKREKIGVRLADVR